MKKLITILLLIFVLTGCNKPEIKLGLKLGADGVIKVAKNKILYDEDILVDGVVMKQYYYVSDTEVPDAVSTNQKIVYEGGKKTGIVSLSDVYYKDGEKWKEIKTDIVDKKAYELEKTSLLDGLFGEANAETISVYSYNDGDTGYCSVGTSWANCYGSTAGSGVGTSFMTECEWYTDNVYYCVRNLLTVNVTIGADETISSSTLYIKGTGTASRGDGTMGLYGAGDYGTLEAADFDLVDITASGVEATRYSDTIYSTTTQGVYTQWNTTGWNGFKLNAAGISRLIPTGNSYWSLRNHQWDAKNTAFTAETTENTLYGEASGATGTANDPYFKIVYASSSAPVVETLFISPIINVIQ